MQGEPPQAFARRLAPGFVVAGGRAFKRWRAKGPRLGDYAPTSTLELPSHIPLRASSPAINFHSHLGRWLSNTGSWMEQPERLVEMMGSCNIESMVNLDGRWGRELEDNLDRYDRAYPDRFFTFCHVDWRLLDEPNGPDLLAESLQRSVTAGARGLKVWKDLGLKVQRHGRTVLPDDPMLSPLWEMAGTLGVPVLIHTADPFAFFLPVDRHNERLEELLRYSHMVSRRRPGRDDFHRLIDGVEHVIASHAKTNFVAAHGFYAENLGRVSTMMDTYANFSVDIAWAHLQFGRQPRTARDLIVKHPDRVLFGTDVFPLRPGIFPVYFRFLETADEAFSYTDEAVPRSGRWLIYGLDLPGPVLDKVYRDNAKRLLHLK